MYFKGSTSAKVSWYNTLMPKQKKSPKKPLPPQQESDDLEVTRITRTLFFVVFTLLAFIVISDAWNLILREKIVWLVGGSVLLFVVTVIIWMLAGTAKKSRVSTLSYRMALVASLVLLAGLFTYNERGMASTSTPLYVIPILVAATLRNRHILIGTALLSIATYFYSTVAYFNLNFNEGYRVELYSKLVLFIGLILCITWLTMILAGLRKDSK